MDHDELRKRAQEMQRANQQAERDAARKRLGADKLRKAGASDRMIMEAVDRPADQQAVYRGDWEPKIVNLRSGDNAEARFLGPVFLAAVHWLTGVSNQKDDSFPCFVKTCRHCPNPTRLYGYAPVCMTSKGSQGGLVIWRAVLAMPKKTAQKLAGQDLRGAKYYFWRENKFDLEFEVKEAKAAFEPPPWFDVRKVLAARYNIPAWPDQSAIFDDKPQVEETEAPDVIPFRKQA